MSGCGWRRFDKDCTLAPGTQVTRVDRFNFGFSSWVKYLQPGDVFFVGDTRPTEPMPDARPQWLVDSDKAHAERLLKRPDAAPPPAPKPMRRPRGKPSTMF